MDRGATSTAGASSRSGRGGALARLVGLAAFLALLACLAAPALAAAEPIAGSAFGATWAYSDLPVATLAASRTWLWGGQANSGPLLEPYAEAPGGQRLVQYFDKSRMELTQPGADPSSIWYVTNGLLAEELVTGRMQLGDGTFHQYAPAPVNVAGDAGDPNGPTYATFNLLLGYAPIPTGWTIIQTVDRAGNVGADPSLAGYGVSALDLGVPTHHDVASVFWSFMSGSGTVFLNGLRQGPLFANPFYATGYPLTEAYWTTVLVGGVSRRVLVQVFERRVLTYTPVNPPAWQVESGNVGQHYYHWRYDLLGMTPVPNPSPPAAWTPQDETDAVSMPGAAVSLYEISGTTADQLWAGMHQIGPHDASGEHAAETTWNVSWRYRPDASGTCQATGVTTQITVSFPHWTPPIETSPALVADWDRFVAALATHEEGHAQLVQSGVANIAPAIAAGSCREADAAAGAVMAQIQQENDAYDAQTGHGASQGATFP